MPCTKASETRRRHEAVNNLIQRAMNSAEIPSVREPPSCSRSGVKKPDGLTIVPWAKGKSLLWDYTSRYTGYAAKQAEDEKYRFYTVFNGPIDFCSGCVRNIRHL